MISRMAVKAAHVWRREGVKGLLSRFVHHRKQGTEDSFDRTRGVSTLGDIALWKLSIPSEDWTSGVHYRPVAEHVFARCMEKLPLHPKDYTFIDLGSGKGRALILAKEAGFRRIIGVEFSPRLCQDAKKNLQAIGTQAEVVCKSAALYDFPEEPSVIFLYNPFVRDVMQRVLDRIHPDGYIVYVNPRCKDLFQFPVLHEEPGLMIFRMRVEARAA